MTEKTMVQVAMSGDGVLSRRGFLRGIGLGAAGLSALSFTDLVALRADEIRQRGMACILLWMGGGPSQFETFDPKPGTSSGGDTKAIDTAVEGIQIAELWPHVAKQMKEVALIRSMTSREFEHQRAQYLLHTGYQAVGSIKFPNFGAVAGPVTRSQCESSGFIRLGDKRSWPTAARGCEHHGRALQRLALQSDRTFHGHRACRPAAGKARGFA